MLRPVLTWVFIFYCGLPKTAFVLSAEDMEYHSTPLPENEPKPSPSFSNNDQPEPGPRWSKAFKLWKWAWPVHVYTFVVFYFFVAIVSFAYLGLECLIRKSNSNRLKVALFINLLLFSLTRGILLQVDPYNSGGLAHELPYFITWSIGFPFILSSFSLLLLALVDTTRISLMPPRFQNLCTLTLLSVCHALIVFLTDLISMRFQGLKILLFLCQIYLSLFGLALSVGFLYVARKLAQNTSSVTDSKIKRLQCLVYVSAAIGFGLVCIQVYSATSVFGVLSDKREILPWPWLALQTCARSVEMGMCFVIVLVFKRTKYNDKDDRIKADQNETNR